MKKPMRDAWKGAMTQRERFYNQMHYLPFDRTVNMEFGYWDDNYKLWDIFLDNGITNEGEADRFFSFEPPRVHSLNTWMSPGFESKIVGQKGDKLILINSDGLLAEVPRDGHGTIPHYIKSSIETPEDWKRVKERSFRRDESRNVAPEILKQLYPDDRDYPVGVNVGSMIGKIRDMLTVEGLAYAVADCPEMVEDMVETVCTLMEDALDSCLPHVKFDFASGWEDICCRNGPLVSMGFFKEVIFPRYKRIGKKLHEHGIDIWYTDCDGDVRPLLPYFLEAGINCLFPYEVNSCLHPVQLLEEYGKDLRIMGGIDKMKLIEGREATKKYLESVAPLVERGGYIPFCDHRCPPDVTPENYLYYLDLKEEMFGLKN